MGKTVERVNIFGGSINFLSKYLWAINFLGGLKFLRVKHFKESKCLRTNFVLNFGRVNIIIWLTTFCDLKNFGVYDFWWVKLLGVKIFMGSTFLLVNIFESQKFWGSTFFGGKLFEGGQNFRRVKNSKATFNGTFFQSFLGLISFVGQFFLGVTFC